jgi:hypothetical protein
MAAAKFLVGSRFVLHAALADLAIETSYTPVCGPVNTGSHGEPRYRQMPAPAGRQGSRRSKRPRIRQVRDPLSREPIGVG